MLGPELELNIITPEQSLAALSFAEPNTAAIDKWKQNLPMANTGEASRQLYQAISELNQLPLAANVRLAILELLRAPIHFVSQQLAKHYLNQSISLPEQQQKVANLCQALGIHLATGYKLVLKDSLANIASEKARKNFACAAHRTISEYGDILVRSYQLYTSAPRGIWQELHSIYHFSDAIGLQKYEIADASNRDMPNSRVDQAYKRILLLSCCRPNQLRQQEIGDVYKALSRWTDYVEFGQEYADQAVFVIDLEQDKAPCYRSLLTDSASEIQSGLDTAELVQRITNTLSAMHQKGEDSSAYLEVPSKINERLLNHIHHSLGILTKRTFKRIANNGSLYLGAGLSAGHYYTSGQRNFQEQLLQSNAAIMSRESQNKFMEQSRHQGDAWSEAHDAEGLGSEMPGAMVEYERLNTKTSNEPEFPEYQVKLINTSPGGYCLQWSDTVPANIQAGEVLVVRESRTQPWSVAVVRWIRYARKQGTQVGIELLAPNAQPCAVQLLHKTGDPSEYLRGLLLPELSSIGQPATLITPRLPFQTGSKVSIRQVDSESKSVLKECIASTASFSQFLLSEAVQLQASASTLSSSLDQEDDFDSLWPSL